MDLVVPKDLMVSRRIHHLNSKLEYMGVLDIKEGEDLKEVEVGNHRVDTKTMAVDVMVLVVVDTVVGRLNFLGSCKTSDTFGEWEDELALDWREGGGDTKT